MKVKLLASIAAAALAFCCLPALAGCSQETYVEYTLYSSSGDVIRTDNLSENPDAEAEGQPSSDSLEDAPEGSYYMVTGYSGKPQNVVIPAEVNGVEVRGIGEQAFANCKSITSLEVQEGVSEAGQAAFIYCFGLITVSLPSTMDVGESMFGGCWYLASVTLAEGITSIGNQAFYQCYELEEINGDDSNPVNLPSTLEFIGGHAFYDCNALSGSITIPEGVTEIKQYAFSLCSSVSSFTLAGNVTELGFGAFGGCHALESIILSDSVVSIGDYAFANTYELTTITLPSSVSYIGQYAFSESGITSVTMPTGKGAYLYTEELAEDDPETEEDESEAVGSEDAEDKLYDFYYDESVANNPNAKGRVPSSMLANAEQAAEWLTGKLVDAYWYFVIV